VTCRLSPLPMVLASPDAALSHLLKSLPSRPFRKDELDKLVSEVLQDTPSKSSLDVRRGQWELALKNEIFTLAVRVIVLLCHIELRDIFPR
jgi:hypothetical protein